MSAFRPSVSLRALAQTCAGAASPLGAQTINVLDGATLINQQTFGGPDAMRLQA